MIDKLISITNQLLDLGKRNRLLNYKDSGLKTLKVLNKNIEEIFRGIKGGKEYQVFNVDPLLTKYQTILTEAENNSVDDLDAKVYDIAYKSLEPKDLLCYKKSYPLSKALKSLLKDYKFTTTEKGINSLYMSFGFIHYIEEEIEYTAPLLLIPIELSNEEEIYTIKEYEDEVLLNPTLKYYFNSRFNVDLLDYDNDSLSTYFTKIREALDEKAQLEDGIALGIYSFYKMNMYNDLLLNKEIVIQNKNIRALLGEEQKEEESTINQPIYPVVNCDSSQLEAIQFAANGKSFCLQGPPGSGKSQTITNIISSLLGSGKKILFVSEKIAALKVVYENLRRARLNDFAVELHSNKANKKEFIENIYKTATLPKYDLDFKTNFLGRKYESLKSNLASYEKELHSVIPSIGMNLFDLYSAYLSIEVEPIDVSLDIEYANSFDLDKNIDLLNDYKRFSKIIGYDYRLNPLFGLNMPTRNYFMDGLERDLENSIELLEYLSKIQEIVKSEIDIPVENVDSLFNVIPRLERIVHLKTFDSTYLNSKSRSKLKDLIEKYMICSKSVKTNLLEVYSKSIIQEDLDKLCQQYKEAMAPKGIFKLSNKELKDCNERIFKYRTEKAKPEIILAELEELAVVKKNLNLAVTYSSMISKILGDIRSLNLNVILSDLRSLEGMEDMQLSKTSYEHIKESIYLEDYETMNAQKQSLQQIAKLFDLKEYNIYQLPVYEVLLKLKEIYEEKSHFLIYSQVKDCLEELRRYNSLDYLNTYISSGKDIEEISLVYKKMFYKQKIDSVLDSSSLLSNFRSMGEEEIIESFRHLDEQILSVNRDYIISLNSQKRPDEAVIEGSEFKILTREYNKLRRQLPIRTLLEQTFELVLDIKPVFLMSPLSVSTYLASELEMFDCVIFDEASQIFASDALGAIYRAKQCIVIGDTKQMPPTNFFQASADEVVEKEYDLESILDKASLTFPTSSLKWHYRSRSEELITFSNQSFYNSNLITIPQAKKHEVGFGIDFYYVENGRYDTGTRTNAMEASKVCDMVFEHYKSSKESLGVVAFSNVQAELITTLIEKRLKKEPEFSKYFNENVDEPFFVKNLESVQGDERDRIIFSICYGYNQENKFYQRFGPLNNLGGERRLNVAITRAKYNISIVSSIRYTDIRLNTESLGVLLLRSYLEFAENITMNKNYTETENGMIRSVREYLETLGYTVFTNYGSSSFKIDLAVKKDNDFVMAIMIDSQGKYSSNLTDKYRLEKLLLERLGWRYFKLHSTAWIHNNDLEKERLLTALNSDNEQYDHNFSQKSYLKIDNSIDSLEANFLDYESFSTAEAKLCYEAMGMEGLLSRIIQIEAPIHEEYLYKKVAAVFDKVNANASIKELVDKNVPKRILKIEEFYFNNQISDIKLRLHSNREIAFYYFDELVDGIYTIIQRNNGIQLDGCYKTMAQLLEFEKVMPNLRKRLDEVVNHLKQEGKIVQRKECLYLSEE